MFAPSRADARLAETRTWIFAPEVAETLLETEPQAVGTHQENGLWNYEHAPGCTQAAESVAEGSFSITKQGWQGYPSNPKVPKPEGRTFRLLQGAEKDAERKAANNANRAAHRADPSLAGKEIHEIQPVKLGGSPTDPANNTISLSKI